MGSPFPLGQCGKRRAIAAVEECAWNWRALISSLGEAAVKANFAPGLRVPPGQAANVVAYDRWVGQWSRVFVSAVIFAAEIAPGQNAAPEIS
jgi:hypothetical protein